MMDGVGEIAEHALRRVGGILLVLWLFTRIVKAWCRSIKTRRKRV